MYPKLISIYGITVYTYGFFVALGILAGWRVVDKLVKYRSLSSEFINYIITGVIICGLLGARLSYVLLNYTEYISAPFRIIMFWEGGLVFSGGIIGGTVWIIYSAKKWSVNILSVLDVLAPAIALAHAVGRIGCFFAGCCHGKPAGSFPSVTFSNTDSLAYPLGIGLHPTQIYSSVFLFILAGILFVKIKTDKSGQFPIFGLYLLCYGVFRIFIELLRGDYRGELLFGCTPTQWVAFVGIVFGIIMLLRKKTNKNEQ